MHQLDLFNINYKNEAVDFLKSNLSGKGEIFVGFSGGKDSICTAELMRLSGIPHRLFYSMTGIDPPEVVRFIRKAYPGCVFLKPKRTFWRNLSTNVPPSDRLRWCCTALKKEPAWKMPHKVRVFGIRAEESARRARYGRINHKTKLGHTEFYPIYHWREWQIWEFIGAQGLEYPSLYNEGFERLGCVICPYHSEKTGQLHKKYRDRWPGYFDLWEKSIDRLYKKRVEQGGEMFYPSGADFCRAWYLNKNARWRK